MSKKECLKVALEKVNDLKFLSDKLISDIDNPNIETPEAYTKDQMKFLLNQYWEQLAMIHNLMTM